MPFSRQGASTCLQVVLGAVGVLVESMLEVASRDMCNTELRSSYKKGLTKQCPGSGQNFKGVCVLEPNKLKKLICDCNATERVLWRVTR